jgi:hypothetical protein
LQPGEKGAKQATAQSTIGLTAGLAHAFFDFVDPENAGSHGLGQGNGAATVLV